MHYQREPDSEVKVVRCVKGCIWDVIIDIRPNSPSYCRWQIFELSSVTRDQLYIPQGFAHGFQTLSDDVEVNYLISLPYSPQSACGIRFTMIRFSTLLGRLRLPKYRRGIYTGRTSFVKRVGVQIVDASLVAAPRQRNTRRRRSRGPDTPNWKAKPAKLRHKDRDARGTVKYTKAKPREDGLDARR